MSSPQDDEQKNAMRRRLEQRLEQIALVTNSNSGHVVITNRDWEDFNNLLDGLDKESSELFPPLF